MFSVPIPDHAIQIGPGAKKKMLVFPKHTLERRAARAQDV